MGVWIRIIGSLGIHYVPATDDAIIQGVNGVVGDQFLDKNDRTELGENGINLIQDITGTGIKMANALTVSTDDAYLHANAILMRNYIKVSAEDSLRSEENTPNSQNRINAGNTAINFFLFDLWTSGSTGNVPLGETFGQREGSQPEEHYQVNSDITVNPQASINLGQRDYEVYFTAPPPALSIFVGVGILVR
jgi:phage tail sheath protein FI